MKIKITKQGKILLLVILGILILGGGGYLLWRVNQPDTVAPTDSDASGGNLGSCCCLLDNISDCPTKCKYKCIEGYKCEKKDSPTCSYSNKDAYPGCGVCVRTDRNCWWGKELGLPDKEKYPDNDCFCSINGSWVKSDVTKCGGDPTDPDPSGCKIPSDCYSQVCEYPQASVCKKDGTCGCQDWNNTNNINPPYCSAAPVYNNLPGRCPTGYTDCGTSVNRTDNSSSCEKMTNISSPAICPGCSNTSVIYRYCKPTTVDTPRCGDGMLGNTPGEQCEYGNPSGVLCTWDTCNQTTCTCPDTPTPICGDGILGNTPGEQCEVDDPDGVSCTWDTCNQNTCTCPEIPDPNPDWDITKVGAETCIEEGDEVMGQVVYTITVTNTGEGAGELTRLEDDLDSKVISTNILDITTGGTYSTGVITWNLNQTLQPEEQLTFTYTVKIPSTQFGTYTNTATAYPEEGDDISATFEVDVTCELDDEVPDTGLFDSVVSRIVFGVILILVGLNYRKLNYAVNEYTSDRRIKRFENRVANKK